MMHIAKKPLESMRRFWKNEDGIGTLEIIMIVAVIVIIAVAFRKWIMKWINGLFQNADQEVTNFNNVNKPVTPE